VLAHHTDLGADNDGGNELAGLIAVADYVCHSAGLGVFAEPPKPTQQWLASCFCADDAAMNDTVAAVRQAYVEESALFKLV
jgi:hypothetical protein